MNRKWLALLMLVLVVLVGGLWFVLQGGSGEGGRGDTAAATDRAPSPRPAAGPGTAAPVAEVPPAVPEEAPRQAARAPAGPTPVPVDAESFPTDQARWVQVSVLLPAGSPPDETLRLVAFAASGEGDELQNELENALEDLDDGGALEDTAEEVAWVRRSLAATTELLVPLPADAEAAAMAVRGRYLSSETVQIGIVAEEQPVPVRIEPTLGSWVTGVVVLPAGWEEREVDLEEIEVELSPASTGGFGFRSSGSLEAALDEELRFELQAVPARTFTLEAKAGGLAPYREPGPKLEPGEHREVEVAFQLGGRIRGRVTGDDGNPVAGADVHGGGNLWFFMGDGTKTGEDGSYVWSGVKPGKLKIQVEADGWLDAESDSIEIADGQDVEGLDFVLGGGRRLTGRVVWPDGSPAAGATVWADQDSENRFRFWSGNQSGVETDEEGAFAVSGLGEGSCNVRAELVVGDEDEEESEEDVELSARIEGLPDRMARMIERSQRKGGVTWVGRAKNVPSDTTGLVLPLEEPSSLTGVVVDDLGQPIPTFRVEADPVSGSPWRWQSEIGKGFESEDGSFVLEGLYVGEWKVTAEAEGFASLHEPVTVEVPAAEPVTITLTRGAKLTGLVVDPAGQPVVGADVEASEGSQGQQFSESVETAEEGRFELEGLPARTLSLVASHADWAESEPLSVELAASEERSDLVLQLRIGGRITGEVYDDDGEPKAGQNVTWSSQAFGLSLGQDGAQTDGTGRFVLEHVTPGKVVVTAMPSQEEIMEKISGAEDETGFVNMLGQMKTKTVEVADGAEVHVVLGGTPKRPVRVHGRVTEGGEPVPEAAVVAVAEGGSFVQGMKAGSTDEDGRYELTLDRPGAYMLGVNLERFEGMGIEFYVDVPDAAEFSQDLALPTGRIAGRVVGPDGSPVEGVGLRINCDDRAFGMANLDQSANVESKVDGRFEFEHLWPGVYSLRVGGLRDPFGGGEATYGSAVVSDVRLEEGGAVEDLEIRLSGSGKLAGTVRDETGAPLRGATVFVHDEKGRLVSNVSFVTTDGGGKFTYSGLAPGQVTASAQSEGRISPPSDPVRILEGETSEVHLTASPGTFLVISALDDGEPVRASLRVLDAQGREVHGKISMDQLQALFSEGFSSKDRRIGPVTPGDYTVIATTSDGREASRKVQVRADQDERKVKLRLK